ncbi:ATP-binding cassette sub-family A member 17-like isoform X2 [Lycorma delicatula]|uniref:ATP-binding cassette sub-family A member 17-like isoform X2 n=1 Tax=Lycorma delicatula TaxID=130591 RepID=UPI003F50DCB5
MISISVRSKRNIFEFLFGWTSGNISKIFLLLPHYCLGDGMISIEIMSMRKDIIERGQMVERVIFTSKSIRGKVSVMEKMINIFSMFLYGLVILIIIIILEKSLFSSLFRRKIIKPTVNEKENEDVIQERERVFNRDVLLNKQNILVSNLCKFYQHGFGKKTEVVNNVSFVVNQGDCFGILGLQNSGKTAIVEVLAGLINPSSGNIRVLGLDLKKDLKMIQAYVGFCPTKVLFNPFLTPKEYLEYFSHLKNIPKNNIKQHISFCLFKFNLTNSANTLVGKLSASEKRNLCIAMTILGKPPILLLDEPSQEMNFISRKQLWDILKSMQVDKHLIIFSSRSISECEILCSRFAIINHGRFKFIGTVNNLKNKFGEGYNMNLQISSLNVNKITKMKNYLRKYVSNCLLLDELSNCLHYHIPNPELYIALTTVEKAIEREMISDYFITKTKIRDVFTKIIIDQQTAVQIDDEIEDKKKHIFPTLLSCCSFLLCLKFFSAGNILYDEDDDLENSDSDDDTDLQSTSSDESDVIKNFFSKLCSPH